MHRYLSTSGRKKQRLWAFPESVIGLFERLKPIQAERRMVELLGAITARRELRA